jgi:hypothetical protein
MFNEGDKNFIVGVAATGVCALLAPLVFCAYAAFQYVKAPPLRPIQNVTINDQDEYNSTTNEEYEHTTENNLKEEIRCGLFSLQCNKDDQTTNGNQSDGEKE